MDATKVPESVARFAASCRTDAPTYSPDRPSLSAFVMEDGVVYHTYSAYARGVDGIWGMHQWPDRAPKGRMITAAECRAARGLPLDQARSCRAVACLVATHPPRIYRRWIAAGGSFDVQTGSGSVISMSPALRKTAPPGASTLSSPNCTICASMTDQSGQRAVRSKLLRSSESPGALQAKPSRS